MGHTIQFLIRHGYALVFLWLLAEQTVVPLPSIPLLLACGALARAGRLDFSSVLACGTAAVLIADNLWFQVGRRRGGRILRLVCRVSLEPDSCVRRTENAFQKYGIRSLLVSKFVPGLNAVAAPLAGVSGVKLARFLIFDTLGALIWIGTYTGIGYLLSDQLETVAAHAMRMGFGMVVLVAGLLAAWIAWKIVQRRRFIRKMAVARITAEELRSRLQAGEDVVVVDVRNKRVSEAEPMPGALRIPVEELEARHPEIPRDREIVLFCS